MVRILSSRQTKAPGSSVEGWIGSEYGMRRRPSTGVYQRPSAPNVQQSWRCETIPLYTDVHPDCRQNCRHRWAISAYRNQTDGGGGRHAYLFSMSTAHMFAASTDPYALPPCSRNSAFLHSGMAHCRAPTSVASSPAHSDTYLSLPPRIP